MTYNISNMHTIVDHLHKHLTHPKHLLHNMLLSVGVAGLLMAVDQFYTGNYQTLAAGQMPVNNLTILPESMYSDDKALKNLIPATNSVRGVCYIQGTDMWDVRNHRTCMTGEPVCRTIKGVIIGCESKRIIR